MPGPRYGKLMVTEAGGFYKKFYSTAMDNTSKVLYIN